MAMPRNIASPESASKCFPFLFFLSYYFFHLNLYTIYGVQCSGMHLMCVCVYVGVLVVRPHNNNICVPACHHRPINTIFMSAKGTNTHTHRALYCGNSSININIYTHSTQLKLNLLTHAIIVVTVIRFSDERKLIFFLPALSLST